MVVIYVCLQYFDTVGWVLRPVKNRRPYNLYCGGDVKPCSINQSINHGSIDVPPLNTASLTVDSTMPRLKTQLFSATSAAAGIFSLVAQLSVYALRMFLLLLYHYYCYTPEAVILKDVLKNVKI